MTRRIGRTALLIEAEEPQQCDFCGEISELRPYGPKGEAICFPCAMKDEKSTERQFAKRLMPLDDALTSPSTIAQEEQRFEHSIPGRCHADRDGDCTWSQCPQIRDGEPQASGRHCPLDVTDPEL